MRELQNQESLPVGSLTPRKVDARVIAATNRDLRVEVKEKRFREDLYFRLSMVEIRMPSLAERKEDVPLLQRHFIERFSQKFHKDVRAITQRAQIVLGRHDWPGNVRELENVIGHACMMTLNDTIDVPDLPEYLRMPGGPPAVESGSLDEQERRLVADALERASGNQSEAARLLRIGRDALRYKMKKFNLA